MRQCCSIDMDLPEKNCPELTQTTADAIDDAIIHQLFVSTQMNNLDICVKSALEWGSLTCHIPIFTNLKHVLDDFTEWQWVFLEVVSKFPHYWVCIFANIYILRCQLNWWQVNRDVSDIYIQLEWCLSSKIYYMQQAVSKSPIHFLRSLIIQASDLLKWNKSELWASLYSTLFNNINQVGKYKWTIISLTRFCLMANSLWVMVHFTAKPAYNLFWRPWVTFLYLCIWLAAAIIQCMHNRRWVILYFICIWLSY